MKYAEFRNHIIQRTCDDHFDDLRKYREYLNRDFQGRCCYCNMPEELVTVSFHIDHFIPSKIFKGKKDSLRTDYNNLMWACPKCNLSKGSQYKGDFLNNDKIENEYFYNPVEVDYNEIFFRNEYGSIASDDPKGQDMIKRLKLYRPVHNLALLIEHLESVYSKLKRQEEQEKDIERKKLLESALNTVSRLHMDKERLFRAAYKGQEVFSRESYIEDT